MARNKKVRVDRVIILLLVAVLVVALLICLAHMVVTKLNFGNKKPDDVVIVDPSPVVTTKGISVEKGKYTVYVDDTDKLGFNFVIAELTFKSEEPVSFDLSNFQTSQKIYLNNVSNYLQKLEALGYKTSKLNYALSVTSTENEYTCNIFIPYTTSDSSLRLLNATDASMITFDLENNISYISSLKIDDIAEDKTIEVNNTTISIADSYVSTMMLCNGEEYNVASTRSVYTFEIYVSEIEGNVLINEAYFVPDKSDTKFECMSNEFSSVKAENVLGKKLEVGNNGALFFEMNTKEGSTSGTLWIGLSNKLGELIKVQANLE